MQIIVNGNIIDDDIVYGIIFNYNNIPKNNANDDTILAMNKQINEQKHLDC